jgi:hypothetical protein
MGWAPCCSMATSNGVWRKSGGVTFTASTAALRVDQQAGGVPEVEQKRLAQEARAYYLAPSSKLCSLDSPSEFDLQMLELFESIENGASDIDARIDRLRLYYRRENFWERFKDRTKVVLVWRIAGAALQRRDSKLGKTAGMWQLRCNWNRLGLITNRWITGLTVAPQWIGPARTLPPS